MRTGIGLGIESFGACDEDPIRKYILGLNATDKKFANDNMRGKVESLDPEILAPGTAAVHLSQEVKQYWRRHDNGRTDKKASVIAKLLKYALRHDGGLVKIQ